MKQRATLDEQINTLVSHGVTFDLMDEEKARRFLSNNSYFFKIKSYENNYRKTIDESGGYVYDNLDFGHLVELSLVDFALSRLVWSMCSSIEHSIKVRFNQLIMKDQNPDIADICVRRCFSGNLPTMHDNPYTDDMKTGLQGDFALWNLWELLGFNDQLTLFNTYWRYRHNENHPYQHLLFIVRKMRNAVSHGNCLLTDMSRSSPTRKIPAVPISKSPRPPCAYATSQERPARKRAHSNSHLTGSSPTTTPACCSAIWNSWTAHAH